jgi:hypothetical protein
MAKKALKEFPRKPLTEEQVMKIYCAAKCKYSSSYAMMIDDAFRGADPAAAKHGIWVCYDSPWFSLMMRFIRSHKRWESIPESSRRDIVEALNGKPVNFLVDEDVRAIYDEALTQAWQDREILHAWQVKRVFYGATDELNNPCPRVGYELYVRGDVKFEDKRWFATFRNAIRSKKRWTDLNDRAQKAIVAGMKQCVVCAPW